MDRVRLEQLLARFGSIRAAVLGDLFLDRWLMVDASLDEPSVETGLPARQVVSIRSSPGAAGTVLNNLSALEVGKAYAVGFAGLDGEGWELLRALKNRGIDTRYVARSAQRMTPAYIKPLFSTGSGPAREGSRLDIRNRTETPRPLQNGLIRSLHAVLGQVDALIVLDQVDKEDTGVVTAALREEVARQAAAHPEVVFYADSRFFIRRFRNVVVKCNEMEASQATASANAGFSSDAVFAFIEKTRRETGRDVFVTCGGRGIACEDNGRKLIVPAVRQPGEIDICGAGDAATAGIVCALCAGASPSEAAFVGNLTAGVAVRKLGTTGTADRREVLSLYIEQFSY